MKNKIVICSVMCFLFYNFGIAQEAPSYPLFQNNQIIKTPHFDIIFPKSIEAEASRVASLVEYVYGFETKSLTVKQWGKFPLILSNQNITSNAYVTLGIKKSEWYNVPFMAATGGNTEWYQDLALHEMRHMVQFEKMRSSNLPYSILTAILGEYGHALLLLSLPAWFYEGDAVCMETALSHSGRGRLPAYSQHYRALILDSQSVKYNPMVYWSFKKYYPNHYIFGYNFSAYLRQTYGTDVWNSLYKNYSWQYNLRRISGKSVKQNFNDFWIDIKSKTLEQVKNLDTTTYQIVSKPKKKFTQEINPVILNDSLVLFIRSSLKQPQTLVIQNINTQKEKNVGLYTGKNMNSLVVSDNLKLVWVERVQDRLFSERDYGVIVCYDLKNQSKKIATKKTKYINAIINKEGNKALAVSFNEKRACQLQIVDIRTGKILQKLEHNPEYFISDIAWNKTLNQVAYTQIKRDNYMELVLYNISSNQKKIIASKTDNTITHLAFNPLGDKLFYHSTYSGIDNIYAYNQNDSQHYQVVSDKIGADFPTVDNKSNKLYYMHYTALGNRVAFALLDTLKWTSYKNVKPHFVNYFQTLQDQEYGTSILDSMQELPVETYFPKKFYGISKFRFHSWTTPLTLSNKLTLVGNDLLNSISINPFVGFTINENQFTTGVNIAYNKIFPVIFGGYELVNRAVKRTFKFQGNSEIYNANLRWKTHNFSVGLLFPLNFSRANHSIRLSGSTQYIYQLNTSFPLFPVLVDSSNIVFLGSKNFSSHLISNEITFQHSNTAVVQADLLPRSSQAFKISHITQFGSSASGNATLNNISDYQISATTQFIFPAFDYQDRFILVGNIAWKNKTTTLFTPNFNYTKGYTGLVFQNFYGFSANYLTPPLAIDVALPKILRWVTLGILPPYIKAVRAIIFYDRGYLNSSLIDNGNTYTPISSVGSDVIVQINYFQNPLLSIPLFFRFAYIFDKVNAAYTTGNNFFFGLGLGLNF